MCNSAQFSNIHLIVTIYVNKSPPLPLSFETTIKQWFSQKYEYGWQETLIWLATTFTDISTGRHAVAGNWYSFHLAFKKYDCTIEWEEWNSNGGLLGTYPANQFRQEKGTSQPISCHTPRQPLPAHGSARIDKCRGISALECEDSWLLQPIWRCRRRTKEELL